MVSYSVSSQIRDVSDRMSRQESASRLRRSSIHDGAITDYESQTDSNGLITWIPRAKFGQTSIAGRHGLEVYPGGRVGVPLPSEADEAVPLGFMAQYVNDAIGDAQGVTIGAAIGTIQLWAGTVAPPGWVFCDGAAYSRTEYASAFAIMGTTYGSGDGSTTFNVPNFQGRSPVGFDSSQTEFNARGKSGGAKTYSLTVGEMPAHNHTINHAHASATTSSAGAHTHTAAPETGAHYVTSGTGINANISMGGGSYVLNSPRSAGAHTHTVDVPAFSGSSGSAGSGTAFSLLSPYIAIQFIIKMQMLGTEQDGLDTLTRGLTVTGTTSLGSALGVAGSSTLTGPVTVSNTLSVVGGTTLSGPVSISSTLGVSGAATFSGPTLLSAGAQIEPVELGANQNLNNYIAPGYFWQSASANATTLLNYPAGVAGYLEVSSNLSRTQVTQRYTTCQVGASDGDVYQRHRHAGAWSSWKITSGTLQTYTPTFGGVTLGTSPIVAGAYTRIGSAVQGRVRLTLGAGTAVTGLITVSLPLPAATGNHYAVGLTPIGDARAVIGGSHTIGQCVVDSVSTVRIASVTNGAGWTTGTPGTWAAGSLLAVSFAYETE